jgi:hypothetical protein
MLLATRVFDVTTTADELVDSGLLSPRSFKIRPRGLARGRPRMFAFASQTAHYLFGQHSRQSPWLRSGGYVLGCRSVS